MTLTVLNPENILALSKYEFLEIYQKGKTVLILDCINKQQRLAVTEVIADNIEYFHKMRKIVIRDSVTDFQLTIQVKKSIEYAKAYKRRHRKNAH